MSRNFYPTIMLSAQAPCWAGRNGPPGRPVSHGRISRLILPAGKLRGRSAFPDRQGAVWWNRPHGHSSPPPIP